jgi:hypothetical protein
MFANLWTLCRYVTAVYCENNVKHINIVCEKSAEFLSCNAGCTCNYHDDSQFIQCFMTHGMAWGIKVQLWPFLTRHYIRRTWLAPLSSHLIHWIRKMTGTHSRYARSGEEKKPLTLPGIEHFSLALDHVSVLTEVITCRTTAQRLVVGLSSRKPEFNPRPVYVRYVVNRVALGYVSVLLLCFSPVSIIAPMAHSHSFIHSFL